MNFRRFLPSTFFLDTRCLQTGDQNCGEFMRFLFKLPYGRRRQVACFRGESQPKMTLIGLFQGNLKLGSKLGLGTGPLSGPIISGRAGATPRQLMRDCLSAWITGQLVGHPKASQGKGACPTNQITHESRF